MNLIILSKLNVYYLHGSRYNISSFSLEIPKIFVGDVLITKVRVTKAESTSFHI